MNPSELIIAARDATKLGGCTCQPDIAIVSEGGEVYRAIIAHDPTCQLVEDRSIGQQPR